MGGAAGAISKTAAAPIERVKLLIQNQGAMIASGRLDRPYKGIIECFQRTYAEEGLKSCMFYFLLCVLKLMGFNSDLFALFLFILSLS
jgi:hypothetical protein